MVMAVIAVLVWNFSTRFQTAAKAINFTQFLTAVESGQIAQVTMTGNEITGVRKDGETFRTYAPPQYEGLGNRLFEKGVDVTAREATTSPWAALLYNWAPILLMIGFWVFIMRQMQSGGNKALSFGKSKAKLSSSAQKKVTFKDVAGVDEAKEELQEIIDFLREPQKFQKLGGRIPKGVLLMGPPGTGKSTTSKVLAGELHLPLFVVRFEALITRFKGETAAKLRLIFDAMQNTRGVYLFDEFDAIGAQRALLNDTGEIRRVLNSFLQFLEEEDSLSLLVAATNHVELLDRALFRRFDDVLRFRPRDQHVWRDLEVEAPEFAVTHDVGDRLALGAARHERRERRGEAFRRRRAATHEQRRTIPVEDVACEDVDVDCRVDVGHARLHERPPRLLEDVVNRSRRRSVHAVG